MKTFNTPPSLADGYYTMRVTVVGASAGEDGAEIDHFDFAVKNGSIVPMNVNDWLAESRANLGVPL